MNRNGTRKPAQPRSSLALLLDYWVNYALGQ